MRRASKVPVKLLDLSHVMKEILTFIKSKKDPNNAIEGLLVNGPWGIVETRNGIYCLNALGIGSYAPITQNNSAVFQFFVCFSNGVANGFNPVPNVQQQFTDVDLMQLPYFTVQSLDAFILRWNPEVEKQYVKWEKLLSPIILEEFTPDQYLPDMVIQEAEQDIAEKSKQSKKQDERRLAGSLGSPIATKTRDLTKYGAFLVNRPCNCLDTQSPLISVNPSVCICGNESGHTHCRNCGGIIAT